MQGGKVKIKVVSNAGTAQAHTVAEIEVYREKIMSMVAEVKQLVQPPILAENLEMAAQLLEDSCGDVMKWLLKGMLELKVCLVRRNAFMAPIPPHATLHWNGGRRPPPPPSRAPSLCPATLPPTASASLNGIRK